MPVADVKITTTQGKTVCIYKQNNRLYRYLIYVRHMEDRA